MPQTKTANLYKRKNQPEILAQTKATHSMTNKSLTPNNKSVPKQYMGEYYTKAKAAGHQANRSLTKVDELSESYENMNSARNSMRNSSARKSARSKN